MININKKGDVTMFLILAIVAVVVLVLAVIAFTGKGGELSNYVVNLFPWFNNTKGNIQGTEILRYSVLNDKVQYYDGSLWRDFSKGTGSDRIVEFNDKKVLYDDAYNAFRAEYYTNAHASRGMEEIELTSNAARSFSSGGTFLQQDLKAVIEPTSYITQIHKGVQGKLEYFPGDIAVRIVPKAGGNYIKVYLIRLNNEVYDLTEEPSWLDKIKAAIGIDIKKYKKIDVSSNEDFNRIITGVKKWRSSTLSNAMQLSYSVVDKREMGRISQQHTETNYYCLKPIDYDFVIYLDTPSSKATC